MEEIIDLCKEIKSCGTKCKSCGGTIKNCSCSYCGKKSEELEQLVSKLSEKLDILKKDDDLNYAPVCQLFNYLYNIKDFHIPEVDEILGKANYGSKLEHELEKIVAKENSSQNISVSEYELVDFLLLNGNLKNYKINWCNFLIKALANKKFHIEYEDLEKLLIMYSEELLNEKYQIDNAKCIIESFPKKEQHGKARKNKMHIDKDLVNKLYQNFNGDNMFKVFNAIFHEATHVSQYFRRINNNISFYDLILTKDYILRNYLNDYYDNNYYLSSEEIEAHIEGYQTALSHADFLGLTISDEIKKEESYKIENLKKIITNLNRKYQGNYVSIDDLIQKILSPEMLKEYPQLQLEYVIENGYIRRKTLEEVEENYHNYLNGTLKLNGKKEEIEYYFDSLKNTLDSSKRKEI